jgi:magnesium transporter
MIQMLLPGESSLSTVEVKDTRAFRDQVDQARWIDLFDPEPHEEQFLKKALNLDIPSHEEMKEISESSRLFVEGDALYLSCWLLCYETAIPQNASVAFVITPKHFVSIRYSDHHAFRIFRSAQKGIRHHRFRSTDGALLEVLEAAVGHIASTLRLIEQDLNNLSLVIFGEQKQQKAGAPNPGLKRIVQRLGKRNSLVANLRESAVSLSALTPFLIENTRDWMNPDLKLRFQILLQDIQSLREYDGQLTSEIGFLLDSTVGLIGYEQNQTMKFLSVAALLLVFV